MSEPKTAEVKVADIPANTLESIAHNLCSLHGFNPAHVMRQKDFAVAVITEYLRAVPASPPAETGEGFTVDQLAQEIRRVDGNHSLGAGALAEALMPFLSAQPVSPSEWEIKKTLTELRVVHSDMTPSQLERFDCDGAAFSILRAIRLIEKLTHPASDQSDTERMRAALEPFDVTGIPEWDNDDKVYLSCGGEDLDSIRLGDFRRLAKLRADLGEC